ncbi:hypothetical protein [Escherichia coli]|uniref:hypothetical protein n=1 Tax=Escherichia coli TaxID=562 RepID=UPI000B7CF8E7|nr:hypothetical protein [Escherichia coli]MDM1653819.1 hypothetical protein [Escherichia coli]MDM1663063.1 hypothetical protein [Escherichia coli]
MANINKVLFFIPYLIIAASSALLALLQRPGYILWGDSYVRWGFAKKIAENGLLYDYSRLGFENWHNTFPTVLQGIFWSIAPSLTAFSMSQAFITISSSYLLFYCFFRKRTSLIISLLFFLYPVNAVFSVMHMPDAMIVPFVMLSIVAFIKRRFLSEKTSIYFYYLIVFTLFICAVWVRPSFAVTAPVYAWFIFDRYKIKIAMAISLTIFTALTMNAWDKILNVVVFSPASVGMASEIAGISKATDGRVCYDCLDKFGNTENSRKLYSDSDVGKSLWGVQPALVPDKIAAKENSREIFELYINAIKEAPVEFVKMKVRKTLLLIGVTEPVWFMGAYDRSENEKLSELCSNCKMSNYREEINYTAMRSVIVPYFPIHPWLLMLFSLACIIVCPKGSRKDISFIVFVGIAFYSSFILNLQRIEFRYFYLTWVLLCHASIISLLLKFRNR